MMISTCWSSPNKHNLVVRFRGRGETQSRSFFWPTWTWYRPLKQDWSNNLDPFKFNEIDGFFYGRGTSDIKEGDTELIANLIRLKKEGWIAFPRFYSGADGGRGKRRIQWRAMAAERTPRLD